MMLQCPKCGRTGHLPDHLGRTAHRLRCVRCAGRFMMLPVGARDRSASGTEPAPAARVVAGLPRSLGNGFQSSDDDDGAAIDSLMGGPGDSHYELSAVFDDVPDSQVEIPAFSVTDAAPAGAGPSPTFEPDRPDDDLGVPWYYHYIVSWGRIHFFAALGFAACSLSILGYFLIRAVVAGHVIHTSITALIVGCVGTIAFLLLSISVAALVALLVDLGKNMHHMSLRAERSFRRGGEHPGRNQGNLSRSIG